MDDKREAPLVSFALHRSSFFCAVVAGSKQETGKNSLFNVVLIRAFFLLYLYVASTLLSAVSLVVPCFIGDLRLRFLATQNRTIRGAALWG